MPLKNTDNEWELTVGFSSGFDAPWKTSACIIVVIFSLLASFVVMTALVEKKKHELLLYRMMPKDIVRRVQQNGSVIEKYDLATIGIIDIVSFTTLSDKMHPLEIFTLLKELYTTFDAIAKRWGVFNVETIGDAYIVIGGGPEKCSGRKGAEKVAMFVLECIEAVQKYRFKDGSTVQIRSGIASGLVVAGVVGTAMPKFTLFGDTVTLASTLESTSKPMMIQCTALTERLLQDSANFAFVLRERRDGKLPSVTWWIKGSSQKAKKSPQKESTDGTFANESMHRVASDHAINDLSWGHIRDQRASEEFTSAYHVDESCERELLDFHVSSRSEGSTRSDSSNISTIDLSLGLKSKREELSEIASVYSKDSAAFHNYWSR